MQNKLIISIAFVFISLFSFSQKKDTIEPKFENFWKKCYMMGGFGLNFGSVTFVNIAPMLAYRFTNDFHGGAGVNYTYFKDNRIFPSYSTNIYGGSVFGRYFVWENLFVHSEYEKLYLKWSDGLEYSLDNMYVGGGYRQQLGGRVFANILVLYNLNQSPYSPYGNPIIRMGIGGGF